MLDRRRIEGLRVDALGWRRVSVVIGIRLMLVRIRLILLGKWRVVGGSEFMLLRWDPCSAKDGLVGSVTFVRRLLTRPAGLIHRGRRRRRR